MDEMDYDPSELGFDPYSGDYVDTFYEDQWNEPFEDYGLGGDSDLVGEW